MSFLHLLYDDLPDSENSISVGELWSDTVKDAECVAVLDEVESQSGFPNDGISNWQFVSHAE